VNISRTFVNKLVACSMVGLLGLMPPSQAHAASAQASLTVSATVAGDCTVTTNPVAFGAYDGSVGGANETSAATATGSIVVTCGSTHSISVTISQGGFFSSTSGRRMGETGGGRLNFNLLQPDGTSPWGSAVGSVTGEPHTFTATGSNTPDSLNVNGVIPAGQIVNPGSYSATLTATIVY